MLFCDCIEEYLNHHKVNHPASYKEQVRVLKKLIMPIFGHLELSKIKYQDIEKFKSIRQQDKVKNSTINRNLTVLSAYLSYLIETERLRSKPKIKKLKELNSKPPQFYTINELAKIYKANPNFAHWWKLVVNTGIRLNEFHKLKWSNINLQNNDNYLDIISTEDSRSKSGKWRRVPLNNAAIQALGKFNKKGDRLVYILKTSVQTKFRRDCERAGLKHKAGIHNLRHTYASHLISNGATLKEVSELLGHSTTRVTEVYTHLTNRDYLKESVSRINL